MLTELRNSHLLPVGMQNDTETSEDILAVSKKTLTI